MCQSLNNHYLGDSIRVRKSAQSVVVIKIELAACQQDTHIGMGLRLTDDFIDAVEEVGIPARSEAQSIQLVYDEDTVPALSHGGKDVGGRAGQSNLLANVIWQLRGLQPVGAKRHYRCARVEEFLNHLEHHSALADARLSGQQNASFSTGFLQTTVNCLDLLARQNSPAYGLIS